MIKALTAKGSQIGICGTCMDARGIRQEMIAEGTKRSTMDELTQRTMHADKVLVF